MINLEEMAEDLELVDKNEVAHAEWLQKRAGRITCSRFGDLIGEGRSKDALFTETGYRYLRQLVAERFGSWHTFSASSLQWGTDNEPLAIEQYRKATGCEVDARPYQYYHYNDWIGGTPDGIIGVDGCVEVKCPFDPSVHVNTLLTRKVPKEYEWQTLGHLLVTGRSWCDFISYDPRMQSPQNLVIVRVERDETRIEFLKSRLYAAVDVLEKMLVEACRFSGVDDARPK